MRATPIRLAAALFFVVPLLNGCSSSFDPTDWADSLDIFNMAKEQKLKGERKPLFPEGVPGVTQGIPPDLVKGYKPPETAAVPQEEPPQEKPKPKPRVVHRSPPKPAPTRVQVSPAAQQAQQQQTQQNGTQAPWPAQQQQQTSPWPDAPAPNTFKR